MDRGYGGLRETAAGDRGSYGPRDYPPQTSYSQRDANYHEAYNARYGIRDAGDQKEPSLTERMSDKMHEKMDRFKDSGGGNYGQREAGYGQQQRGYNEGDAGAGI